MVEPLVVKRMSEAVRSGFLPSLGSNSLPFFCDDDFGGGAFAVDLPGAGGVDAFAVDGHPCGDAGEDLAFGEVELAGVGQREVEQQVAVFADDVDEEVDDLLGGLVGDAAFVVPVADAGVGLPWGCGDAVEDAALAVEGAGADGAVGGGLAEVDGFHFAAVFGGADVVELGDGGVAVLVEGDAAVGVEEVGLVLVDEVFDAAEVLELPAVGCDAAHGLCGLWRSRRVGRCSRGRGRRRRDRMPS